MVAELGPTHGLAPYFGLVAPRMVRWASPHHLAEPQCLLHLAVARGTAPELETAMNQMCKLKKLVHSWKIVSEIGSLDS